MVARAEDVEDSLASPNAPWIESYTGPQALPPQGAHGGSGRLDTKTPSEGTMRREPEAAGLPQPHRSGVAARAAASTLAPRFICAHRTRFTAAFVTVHRRATGSASPQRRSWASGRHFRLGEAKRFSPCVSPFLLSWPFGWPFACARAFLLCVLFMLHTHRSHSS